MKLKQFNLFKISFSCFIKLIFFAVLYLLSSCYEDPEVAEGKDYYPFTSGSYVYHWTKNTTITIHIPSDVDSSGISDYQAGYRNAVISAIQAWNEVLIPLGITLQFTDGPLPGTPYDIKVEWYDGNESDLDYGVAGFAQFRSDKSPSRRLVLTTRTKNAPSPNTLDDIIKIAKHEIGHMLGIWNHSFDKKDLMYPTLTDTINLSNRDKETFKYLYTLSPDVNLSSLPQDSSLYNGKFKGHSVKCMMYLQKDGSYSSKITETVGENAPPPLHHFHVHE